VDFKYVLYAVDGPVATITLNRPEYRNAQSHPLLQDVDDAFTLAENDDAVRVVVVRGAGGDFSACHDLGTPENAAAREARATLPGIQRYNEFKKYNLDLLLRWRNFPKPTIAMVEGYCIYAGWMLAASLDIVFAAKNAQFLAGVIEYMSVPWDIGVKRAKELVFESRFITADDAAEYGFVNRVLSEEDLERETYAYANRIAENNPVFVRFAKVMMNKAQDIQGYSNHLEDALGDYLAMGAMGGGGMAPGVRRLASVDLAVRHRRGDRYGLTPPDQEAAGDS
jgi:enoyl-CoA hydratase